MRLTALALGMAMVAGSGSAFAAAHSDYTKSFPLQTLKTFAFKDQRRISRDPLADNSIWAGDIRETLRRDLVDHGMVEAAAAGTTGQPDFFVAFYVGLKDRYDTEYLEYGIPVFRRGLHAWGGWPRGYDVWSVPFTESTLIVDIIDAHTNQLVWRGYDADSLNVGNPGKTLTKAADTVLARFYHDRKHG